MSNIVTMKCSLGHSWVLPLSNTNYVSIPDRCPKCIKDPNTTITAVVDFADVGSPKVTVEKE